LLQQQCQSAQLDAVTTPVYFEHIELQATLLDFLRSNKNNINQGASQLLCTKIFFLREFSDQKDPPKTPEMLVLTRY